MKTVPPKIVFTAMWLGCLAQTAADPPIQEIAGVEFFESRVRPLLVKHCYECHSAASDPAEGGLQLDSRTAWQRGGDSGTVIVPGRPAESRLIKAVQYQDPELAMPPDNALSSRQINILRAWIEMGAPDPRTDDIPSGVRKIDMESGRQFWSFQPIGDPVPPEVQNQTWGQTPVDRFILDRLEQNDLFPVNRASRRDLIRRVFLDVVGLPPGPEEVTQFVNDDSPDAWTRLIDRLLASKHFGERWGRHWLDVARYADDQLRDEYYYRDLPHAWRYRDWVINATNDDMPFDHFVMQQIAGDVLVDKYGPQATVATGFLALGMIFGDDGDTPEGIAMAKAETLDDRVDTVTRGLLGLTVSCARCHDHKFDPVPTTDYYSLAGVFHNLKYVEDAPLVAANVVTRYRQAQEQIDRLNEALSTAEKADDTETVTEVRQQLHETKASAPKIFPQAHAMVENGNSDMRVALRGNLLKPGKIAPRHFLTVIAGDDPPPFTDGSGRLELAQAIVSPDNPLTARVIVNRIWQHYFGRGIVASASNFGVLGDRPSHPELLDWLARHLQRTGWSLRSVHREILLSSAYQLSTNVNPYNRQKDSSNIWIWRMSRRRLDIEAHRDSLLYVSGELDTQFGGPANPDLFTSYRRTVYGAVRRDNKSASDELLRMFDFPNPRTSSSGRASTTTPQQQLFSLNSGFVIRCARALAARVSGDTADSLNQSQFSNTIHDLFLLVLGRDPSAEELKIADSFINDSSQQKSTELSRLEQYCQVLLISNEAAYRP
ncbi:MAG: PSD1 and planctomycete cytochrome C domain-containing protein [Fuerstiella sp.]|nr:PSD1 and planctomycete cytochrome C domain-containing protein [Fuerstiella sp.]